MQNMIDKKVQRGGSVECGSVRWHVRVWAFGWWDEGWSVGRREGVRWSGGVGRWGEGLSVGAWVVCRSARWSVECVGRQGGVLE